MKIFVDKELFQWEKNRYILLEVDPAEEQPTFAQFYNSRMSVSLDNPVVDGKVKIPPQLLEQDIAIMVIVCSGSYENAHVISRKEFKIIKRARPGNGFGSSGGADEPDIPDTPDTPDVPGGDEPSTDKDIIYDGGEEA